LRFISNAVFNELGENAIGFEAHFRFTAHALVNDGLENRNGREDWENWDNRVIWDLNSVELIDGRQVGPWWQGL